MGAQLSCMGIDSDVGILYWFNGILTGQVQTLFCVLMAKASRLHSVVLDALDPVIGEMVREHASPVALDLGRHGTSAGQPEPEAPP